LKTQEVAEYEKEEGRGDSNSSQSTRKEEGKAADIPKHFLTPQLSVFKDEESIKRSP
jgi:hypothetical protein